MNGTSKVGVQLSKVLFLRSLSWYRHTANNSDAKVSPSFMLITTYA